MPTLASDLAVGDLVALMDAADREHASGIVVDRDGVRVRVALLVPWAGAVATYGLHGRIVSLSGRWARIEELAAIYRVRRLEAR
jgi:hypothetical protein